MRIQKYQIIIPPYGTCLVGSWSNPLGASPSRIRLTLVHGAIEKDYNVWTVVSTPASSCSIGTTTSR